MARIATIDPQSATGKAKTLLDAVQSKMKMVPNLMRVLASSPAALEGYLNFNESLSHGLLSGQLRELISVVVADANGCQYCLSAHTAIGRMMGLKEGDILSSRKLNSGDPKIDTALRFARDLVQRRGQVDEAEVEVLRTAGYSDGEIAEIITNVGLNIFTNYFNNAVQTEIDFPKVDLKKAA
jgi:uncharacterized peroxidase-related enzyme